MKIVHKVDYNIIKDENREHCVSYYLTLRKKLNIWRQSWLLLETVEQPIETYMNNMRNLKKEKSDLMHEFQELGLDVKRYNANPVEGDKFTEHVFPSELDLTEMITHLANTLDQAQVKKKRLASIEENKGKSKIGRKKTILLSPKGSIPPVRKSPNRGNSEMTSSFGMKNQGKPDLKTINLSSVTATEDGASYCTKDADEIASFQSMRESTLQSK